MGRKPIDETGKRYGNLIVLHRTTQEEHPHPTGRIKSCGCLRDEVARKNLACKGPSLGEQKIINILTKENIKFEREKSFLDDKRISNYRFDFFLPEKNICIEFQGKQHMEYTEFFHKKRSDFLKAQERDRRKISYCLAHHIALYCIPYWEIDNLTSFSDMTQKKFLALSKFHNDEVWRIHQKDR